MSHSSRLPVRMYRNKQIVEAADQVAVLLMDYGYSPRSRDDVVRYIVAHGTLEGSLIEPEDMADAEMVLEAALPPVPFDSPCWEREDGVVTLDVSLLLRGEHPYPIACVGDDTREVPEDFLDMLAADDIPPVSGGAPAIEVAEFTPTREDLEFYERWSEALDKLHALEEQRRWYAANPIEGFNKDRND